MSFRITWKTHILCAVLGYTIASLVRPIINHILDEYMNETLVLFPTHYILINLLLQVIVVLIPLTIVHEMIHGAMYKLFGGKVKYGFKGFYAYTQEVSELPILRTKFLIILLAPLSVISPLSLLLPGWFGGMTFFLNLIGSSGDLYMALLLCRCSYESKIIDRSYGFDVI